ncbi:Rv3654c family TadE-like protein [Microbacterium sp. Marseille-Q6965]|uniref:Rv3654c family TadE-like protein n=1 Tax=Microbacterium sp. Marseille-Q6965 TaxID=2965072 RepID=UPI0021B7EC34|nr:Rv3654c family TadE-like protein [Microbacterium sp. Marseille-Q6965]
MAGSLLAAAAVAGTSALMVGLLAVGGAGVASQRIAAVADAAALAAADVASGAIPGDPCERAREVAQTQGAVVAECALDGIVATVAVEGRFSGLPVTGRARAGPPP